MSRIIALKGRGNSGKTTTISLLPNILLANGYSRVAGMFQQHGSDFLGVFENGKQRRCNKFGRHLRFSLREIDRFSKCKL